MPKKELTSLDMEILDRKATKALFDKIKGIKGLKVELRDYFDGFTFEYKGHTYIFTAELDN